MKHASLMSQILKELAPRVQVSQAQRHGVSLDGCVDGVGALSRECLAAPVSLVQDVIVVGGNYAGSRSYPGNKDGTPFLRVGGRWR
jgi:hypothetical protein